MNWTSIGSLIAGAAPTLGGLLGGLIPFPGGAVLGTVAGKVLAEALGVPPTPEAVSNAITTGDPEIIKAKLAQAESAMRAEVDKYKAQLADIQDAREQTTQLATVGSGIAWGAPVISVVIVCGFFAVMSLLFIIRIDFTASTVTLLNVLFGALIPAFGQVCNYWLGSSAGSQNKDGQISAMAHTAAVVATNAATKK
jgi:hypothetical protein